jgi:hypothetical protein
VQFTAKDLEFILGVLGKHVSSRECLTRLLADEETRDLILDDASLLRALLEQLGCLRVSTHFYFYILVRQVFLRAGLADRAVADYVAEVLAKFSNPDAGPPTRGASPKRWDYFVDLLAALQQADDTTSFYLRAHIGNRSLFLAGVFPDRIRHRVERRGAPGLPFYEALGQSNYRAASGHRLAREYDLADIFDTLAERFQTTRKALNELSERLITLGDSFLDAYAH